MRGSAIVLAAALIATGAGVRAAGITIDQSGQQFSEKSVDLKPGDALNFANKDDVSHNITVVNDDDDATDLGLQKPGETVELQVRQGRALQGSLQYPSQHEDDRNGEVITSSPFSDRNRLMSVQSKILAACLGFVAIIALVGGLAQQQAGANGASGDRHLRSCLHGYVLCRSGAGRVPAAGGQPAGVRQHVGRAAADLTKSA